MNAAIETQTQTMNETANETLMIQTLIETLDETRLAEEIVRVLPEGAIRVCSAGRDVVRFAVRSAETKLRLIVMRRSSLRRLLQDPDGPVKIEYLQRDLLRSAHTAVTFTYPRPRVTPKCCHDLANPFGRVAAAS